MNKKSALILAVGFSSLLCAQNNLVNGFAFERNQKVIVEDQNKILPIAWVGGINYTTHANLDLNLDGINDLLVFDKLGDRVLPFVTVTTAGTEEYQFAPEYIEDLPSAEDWIITADYNCDGKLDIFVGESQSIVVYENTSSSSTLEFTKAHSADVLPLTVPAGVTQFYTPRTDIPAIIDLDDDGDLDVLTVNTSGGVDVNLNRLNCGLDFERVGRCWGLFTENGIENNVTLNNCVDGTNKTQGTNATMHSGGALLALDLDADGLKDLLMTDVSFTNVIALHNTGKIDSAVITSVDTTFPASGQRAEVYFFPAMSYADVTGDNIKDLIISPNELTGSGQQIGGSAIFSGAANVNNTLVFKNNGQNDNADFTFLQNDFLQENMIDLGEVAIPRFVDLNGDSLTDLVIANGGEFTAPATYSHYYHYYQNIGTKDSAAFKLVDPNFANISSYNIGSYSIPAFGDLDQDGDQDMIIGDALGQLHYFDNNGSSTTPSYTLITPGIGSFDVGSNAAPFLIDLNADETLDLIVGNEAGKLFFYSNSSSTNPNFSLVTGNLGGIEVYYNGRTVPYAFTDTTGNINLMVGTESDGILQYDSIDTQVNSTASTSYQFGNDSILSNDYRDSFLGIKKYTSRNQFLLKASELEAMGVDFGYIDALHFEVEINPGSTASTVSVQKGFTVKMKNVPDTTLADGFIEDAEEIQDGDFHPWYTGWNRIDLRNSFLYDGESSILIEICIPNTSRANFNIDIRLSDAGFPAHAYGDAEKNGFNVINNQQGCFMPWDITSNLRPNVILEMSPAFANTDNFLNTGMLTAGAFADINDDGYIDAVVGNFSGGVEFFMGKKYVNDVGLEEWALNKMDEVFSVYPNPGNGNFFITRKTSEKATLKVFSMSGALVLQKELNQANSEINLSGMPNGLYIFGIQDNQNFTTQKVVKQ